MKYRITPAVWCVAFLSFPCLGDPGEDTAARFQESPQAMFSQVVPASELIYKWLEEQDFDQGISPRGETNADKVKIIGVGWSAATIDPRDPRFMLKRRQLTSRAQLIAKGSIIATISQNTKILTKYETIENSAKRKIDEMQDTVDFELVKAREQSEALKKELTILLGGVDEALVREIEESSFGDKLLSAMDAGIKKIDSDYDATQRAEERIQRVEELKKRLKDVKDAKSGADKLVRDLEAQKEQIKNRDAGGSLTEMAISWQFPLWGATEIQSIESYDVNTGVYEVAVATVWSSGLQKRVEALLTGQKGEPFPAKLTYNQWLKSQDLGLMVGSRVYFDKDGYANFIGISSESLPSDEPKRRERSLKIAIDNSRKLAIMSVLSESARKQNSTEKFNDYYDDNGKLTDEAMYEEKDLRTESFSGIVNGAEVTTKIVVYPPTGQKIVVAVATINSEMVRQSPGLQDEAYALLKAFNARQSIAKGQQQGRIEAAETTRDNPKLIEQGRSEGRAAVNESNRLVGGSSSPRTGPADSTASSAPGKPQSGTFMSKGVIERDF